MEGHDMLKILCNSTGVILATLMSYRTNKGMIWAIVHGFCSWFYVIYWIIFKS